MADTQTRLESLMEKMAKLQADIKDETSKAEAEKAINALGEDLAVFLSGKAVKAGIDVKVLSGKFFALTVSDDGKLAIELTTKATKATGNGHANGDGHANGNGGDYEYFLADGNGPFADIQTAMDKMGIEKAKRPAHNRYSRLSKDWQ